MPSWRCAQSVDPHTIPAVTQPDSELAGRAHPVPGQALRGQWLAGAVSDDFFFPTLRQLEQQQRELRADEARHAVLAVRARSDFSDIRHRWYDGELDLSQKRALVKESMHAVIVHPVGPHGRGRAPFNPDLLEIVWRT